MKLIMQKPLVCAAICVLFAFALITVIAAENSCPCKVSNEIKPVCGSDGVTYQNYQKLKCKNQCDGTYVKVSYEGACG